MSSEILKTIECLKNGGIIIYPSDTIWAIGCDATNSKAINKIFKIKKKRFIISSYLSYGELSNVK